MAVPRLGFDFFAVPGGGGFAEVGLVGEVAGQCGVVAEDDVLDVRLAGAYGVEVRPHVRFLFVPGDAAEAEALQAGFFAGSGIVLLMPFSDVLFAHGAGEAGGVVTGRFVLAGLRVVGERVFGDFENALGAVEAVDCRRLRCRIPSSSASARNIWETCRDPKLCAGRCLARFPNRESSGKDRRAADIPTRRWDRCGRGSP